jgi:signal peptidase II
MFYFPLIQTTIPNNFPFWAGEDFEFFRPVFNVADASISIGFVIILLFQKKFMMYEETLNKQSENLSSQDSELTNE